MHGEKKVRVMCAECRQPLAIDLDKFNETVSLIDKIDSSLSSPRLFNTSQANCEQRCAPFMFALFTYVHEVLNSIRSFLTLYHSI